jgi:hypothetical protein
MSWILERWKKLGGNDDEHYILPHRPRRPKGPWLLNEPMTAITSAFGKIRKAAGLPHFRIYDCRVQAITKLLSNPMVSPQVSREIAGHISQAMQSRYSIQQFDTKKAALDALEDRPSASVEATVKNPAPELPTPADVTHPAIQAEIARQVALALQERFSAPQTPETHGRRRRKETRVGGVPREEVFYRRSAANLITFPGGQSA